MRLKVNGIDHVNLEVVDLARSVEFYRELFGFEVLEEFPDQKGKIIGAREAKLALYETAQFERYAKNGLSHFAFHVANFDDVEAKCRQMGLEIKYGGPLQWANSRSIYIEDPNGYEIELAEVWGGGLE